MARKEKHFVGCGCWRHVGGAEYYCDEHNPEYVKAAAEKKALLAKRDARKFDELFITIGLSNEVMLTSANLAEALHKVAKRLEEEDILEQREDIVSIARGIMDEKGNLVGEWGVR